MKRKLWLGAGRDAILPLATLMMVALMVVPVPSFLLDVGFITNIMISLAVLMVALAATVHAADDATGNPLQAQIDHGKSTYAEKCSHCHGPNLMNSGTITPDLRAFPDDKTVKLSDIRDGTVSTILAVEIANVDIPWTEPRDLDVRTMSFLVNDPKRAGISSPHPGGPNVAFADGHVTGVSNNVDTMVWYSCFTRIQAKDENTVVPNF